MFKRIKRTSLVLGIALTVILGMSYGTFIFTTNSYRSTEMLVGNLTYGIEITSTGGSETINGTSVSLTSGKTSTVLLKITSLNKIISKYGIDYEINIKNNSSYKTGYSALLSTNQQTYPGTYGDSSTYNEPYNTATGYLANTTGNISGIYDMSGGAHEYMASYISGKPGSSGFTTATLANYDTKYFDVYNASSSINSYQYMILGDATGEMGPFKNYLDGDNNSRWHNSWYGDTSYFVDSSHPWFYRGGYYDNGVLAGQFYFDRSTGGVYSYIGFRIVLSP